MITCMDAIDFLRTFADNSVDLGLVDPPYNVTSLAWDNAPFDHVAMLTEYRRILKPHAPLVVTTNLRLAAKLLNAAPDYFSHELIYEKSQAANFLNAKRMPMACHEYVLVFCDKQATYHPQMWQADNRNRLHSSGTAAFANKHKVHKTKLSGERYPRSIVRFNNNSEALDMGKHSTQKPVSLFEYLILTYSDVGALVVDCCAGSGTTACAARNTGRQYAVNDNDSVSYDVMCKRLALPFTPPLFGE